MNQLKALFTILVSVLFLAQCSFDTKSKIWKDASKENFNLIKNSKSKNIVELTNISDTFSKEQKFDNSIIFNRLKEQKNNNWMFNNLNPSNFVPNLYYSNEKNLFY